MNEWMHRSGTFLPHSPSNTGTVSTLEYVNWYWTFCRVIDEIKQMVRKGREKYRLEEKTEAYFVYFQDGQNWIELAFYGCILTVAGLRLWAEAAYDATRLDEFSGRWVQLLDFCRALYAVAVVLGFYRYIEVMKVYESLGVIYIALQSMYADIGNWITINGFIILGFGVAFTVLMPGEAGKSDFEYDKPFWKSLRALLGDFDVSGVFDYYESAP
eukprot:1644295-Prymnesium_polylepis.1